MAQTHNKTTVAPASARHGGGMRGRKSNSCVGGEIMEVQGGYIIRSTGKKDRHSKVYTANGPRDRRIRLSAHTAIQFYDVQDRLGYDRPSKAVDWLIMKAKAAIDELAQLPAWKPTITAATTDAQESTTAMVETEVDDFEHQQQIGSHNNACSSFLPPSLDSDAIADTIKSFFPIGGPAGTSTSVQFQSCPPDLLSRATSHGQDLRLSLQSFQEPMLLHQQQQQQQQGYFGGLGCDYGGDCGRGGGFVFDTPSQGQLQLQQQQQQQLFGGAQSQFFAQRRPLQSSNASSVRSWIDPEYVSSSGLNQQMLPSLHHQGFAFGGFPGFHVPRRTQGEEEHDGLANKPSSASRY